MDDAMSKLSFVEILQIEVENRDYLSTKCNYQLVVTPDGELQCILKVYGTGKNSGD